MTKETQPLVSVRVITYNSSKTVVETLDSIYNQTYPNIELIISDDCSKDNTVAICRDWLELHKSRFTQSNIITVKKNTGVSSNIARAEEACHGEWVKGIAGDDILFPHCISTYIDYILSNPNAVYVFSKVECFGGSPERREREEKRLIYDFFSWDIKRQRDFLIFEWNCLPGVTNFYNLRKTRELGLFFDERIPLIDDFPRWINIVNKGIKMDFLDEVLVKYRLSETSLSTQNKYSKAYQRSMSKVFLYYQANANIQRFGYAYTINHYCNLRCDWSGNAIYWRFLRSLSKIPVKINKFINKITK